MSEVFVHPNGINESESVGPNTRIWAFAHVMSGARIGASCNIGDSTFIESGATIGDHVVVKNGVSVWDRVTLEDYVFVGPNAVFTNDRIPRAHPDYRSSPGDWLPTVVEEGASIGANATIVCGTRLGAWCVVGAGSVVNRDVTPHALVVGNPARRIGWVCRCGRRLRGDLHCRRCGTDFDETPVGLRAAR